MNNRFVVELKDDCVQVSITDTFTETFFFLIESQTSETDEKLDLVQLQHAIDELEKEKSIISANHSNELINMK